MKNEKFFFPMKDNDSGDKYHHRQNKSDHKILFRGKGCMINGIPETLDKIIEGIPEKIGAIIRREDIQRIDNRCREKQGLKNDGDDVLDISDLYVCRCCDQR